MKYGNIKYMKILVNKKWDGSMNHDSEAKVEFNLQKVSEGLSVEVYMSEEFQRAANEKGGKRVDGLWEFDVAELFLKGENGDYFEFEIDCLGNYLILDFGEIRVRRNEFKDIKLEIETEQLKNGVRHRLILPKKILPKSLVALNGCAILNNEEFLSFVELPGDKPDFHQPDFWLGVNF